MIRSSNPERNWLAAAETALDTAALVDATRVTPQTGQADTMIRAGYLALRSIADFYRIEQEVPADKHDTLSVSRPKFDELLDDLERRGIELERDRDLIWRDYAGWRMNYDNAISGLSDLVGFVPSHWEQVGVARETSIE